jgi:hypothetical protein
LVKEERKANKDRTSGFCNCQSPFLFFTLPFCSVSGLERFGIDAEDLSKRCAIQFAASASVSESNGVLIVQGLRGNEIFKMLKEEYRVPKEFVTLQSKASK